MPVWEQRFRAPTVSLPDWSPHAADRLTFESTESGVWQVHAWDAATGDRRQVTDHPVGVIDGHPDPRRRTGPVLAGRDRRRVRPLVRAAVPRRRRPPVPGGRTGGLERGLRAGARRGGGRGQRPRRLRDLRRRRRRARQGDGAQHGVHRPWRARRARFNLGGLSADGTLLCLSHSEHGDLMHPALRVVDPRTAAVVAEMMDEGKSAGCLRVVAGAGRSAVGGHRTSAPASRRPRSGTRPRARGRTSSRTSTGRSWCWTGGPTPRRCWCARSSRDAITSSSWTWRPAR